MKTNKLNTERELDEEVKVLTNKRVIELLQTDTRAIDTEEFYKALDQAKLGMIFLRDREIMKRARGGQTIRLMTLVYDNPQQRQEYIKAAMPEVQLLE